jgi:hypothetical protein
MRKTVLLILLLLLPGLNGNSFLLQAEDIKTLETGATAPAFSLPGIDGKTYTLDSFRESKILVIIFTSDHCPTAQAYDEFYPLNIEPWEPNITTLVNFDSKWKMMIGKEKLVPTPSEEKYKNVTGLFEGGGYSAKGIFRSEMEYRMKSNSPKGFCSVCREAIKEMIEFYIK